jgi:hypothetical protein
MHSNIANPSSQTQTLLLAALLLSPLGLAQSQPVHAAIDASKTGAAGGLDVTGW